MNGIFKHVVGRYVKTNLVKINFRPVRTTTTSSLAVAYIGNCPKIKVQTITCDHGHIFFSE
jgi:hypothetical protein